MNKINFIFWHHEVHGPLNLKDIWSGNHSYGGSVSRLRIIFWIAKLGYSVKLIGNVNNHIFMNVESISGNRYLYDSSLEKNTILILNDAPSDYNWQLLEKQNNLIKIYWAGVPFSHIWLNRIDERKLDRIVCVSKYHKNLYKVYKEYRKIEYTYSGIDLDILEDVQENNLEKNTVLFISVPRKTKGFHNMLEAWQMVIKEIPDAKLRVCGSALMHDPNTVVGKTGILDIEIEHQFPLFFSNPPISLLNNGIELMGIRTLKEVYSDMKSSALGIVNANFSNSLETYCRSAVEAQAAGIPIIAPNRGALKEVIQNDITGLLINDKNILANKIIRLLKDPKYRKYLGDNGKKLIQPLASLDLLANDWINIAERAIKNENAPLLKVDVYDLLRNLRYGTFKLFFKKYFR